MREVKIDSMDCHAVQAPLAMTEKGKFLNTPQDFFTRLQRILRFLKKHRLTPSGVPCFAMRKQGCADFCAEIRLSVSIAQAKGKLPALSRKAESTSEKLTKEEINA